MSIPSRLTVVIEYLLSVIFELRRDLDCQRTYTVSAQALARQSARRIADLERQLAASVEERNTLRAKLGHTEWLRAQAVRYGDRVQRIAAEAEEQRDAARLILERVSAAFTPLRTDDPDVCQVCEQFDCVCPDYKTLRCRACGQTECHCDQAIVSELFGRTE